MAKPVQTFVKLPDDSANSGPKAEVQSENIGGNVVVAHRTVRRSREKILGRYHYASTLQSLAAAAQDGTTTAFFAFWVPVGATVRQRIRALELLISQLATETDHLTLPRILAKRFTATGTASGGTITAALGKSTDASAVASVLTALTGLTVSLGADCWNAIPHSFMLTTSGIAVPFYSVKWDIPADEDDYVDLAAGEGVVIYQADAGTASDGRRFVLRARTDEVDNS